MDRSVQLTEEATQTYKQLSDEFTCDYSVTDPEFIERFTNFVFDEVKNEVQLDDTLHYLGWLATLLGCQGAEEYRAVLKAALHNGISPVQAKELLYQANAYLGMGRTSAFFRITNAVFFEEGIELPLPAQATTSPDKASRLSAGEEAQVAIFGESMRGFAQRGNPDYAVVNEWLVDDCFGNWYTRGGLDLQQREIATFCILVAQGGCDAQARAHAAGNCSAGNPKELLVRIVLNNLPYIGYPRTLNALAALDAGYSAAE